MTNTYSMYGSVGLNASAGSLQGETINIPYVFRWWVVDKQNPFTPNDVSENILPSSSINGDYIVDITKVKKLV